MKIKNLNPNKNQCDLCFKLHMGDFEYAIFFLMITVPVELVKPSLPYIPLQFSLPLICFTL